MKNYNSIIKALSNRHIEFLCTESLAKHTSIRIGGNCSIFVNVKSQQELIFLVNYFNVNETKYHILGNGTNTLARDENFDGVVISTKCLRGYKITNNSVFAECGLGLFELGKILRANSLGGLEFAYGIPGTVGGAIVMNAGAYDMSIGDFVDYVKVLVDGKVKRFSKQKMQFAYRDSLAQRKKMVVLGAKFNLTKSSPLEVEKLQNKYFSARLQNQPYSELSFGSVFKRKKDYPPISKLIDNLGLKGYRIGGAEISQKHAGFIVNVASATCQDCLLLIKYIQDKIFEAYGFVPEPEVKILED